VGQKINANQIHSEMHPVYGDKCFTKRTGHSCARKKMLGGQKFSSYTEVQFGAISRSSVAWTAASIVLRLRSFLTLR